MQQNHRACLYEFLKTKLKFGVVASIKYLLGFYNCRMIVVEVDSDAFIHAILESSLWFQNNIISNYHFLYVELVSFVKLLC